MTAPMLEYWKYDLIRPLYGRQKCLSPCSVLKTKAAVKHEMKMAGVKGKLVNFRRCKQRKSRVDTEMNFKFRLAQQKTAR